MVTTVKEDVVGIRSSSLAVLAVVALGYWLLAWFGGSFAYAPGYVSPLWPAAGFAIFAVWRAGRAALVGVWLAAYLSYLGINFSLAGNVAAILLASGTCLQVVLAVRWVRRTYDQRSPFARDGDVIRFLLLTGPVSSLVSASVCAGTLVATGLIGAEAAWTSWFGWWAGNAVGVLIVLPLCVILSDVRGSERGRRASMVLIVAIFLAGVIVFGQLARQHMERSALDKKRHAAVEDVFEHAIEGISDGIEGLHGVERLFAAFEWVGADEFSIFARRALSFDGLKAVRWATAAPPGYTSKGAPTGQGRGERPDGADPLEWTKPQAEHHDYFPVVYALAKDGSHERLGYDFAGTDERRDAIIRARDLAAAAVVDEVVRLRDGTFGLPVVLPVYHFGTDGASVDIATRRGTLRGIAVGIFDPDRLFYRLGVRAARHDLTARVLNLSHRAGPRVLWSSGKVGDSVEAGSSPLYREIAFADALFRVEFFEDGPRWDVVSSGNVQLVTGISVIGALIVMFAALSAAGRNASALALVAERTAALTQELEARRAAEASLLLSEARYRKLTELSAYAIYVIQDGRIVFANPACVKAFGGRCAEELIGRSILDFLHPDDRETARARMEAITIGHEAVPPRVLRRRRLDGSEFVGESNGVPFEHEGRAAILNMMADVTNREAALARVEEAEEKVRAIVEHLFDCVVTLDEAGNILSANPAIRRVFGYAPDEVIGSPVSMLVTGNGEVDVQRVFAADTAERGRAQGGQPTEIAGRHRDGRVISIELIVDRLSVAGEAFRVATMRDITERSRMIGELERARVEAEQANRAKSAFLATMSHEIRTPMNGVLGMVDVLMHSRLDDEQAEQLAIVRESAHALLTLIDDLLDLSKIEAGQLTCEPASVNVGELVEGACSTVVSLARRKNVALSVFVAPELPPFIQADPARLRQVLLNLIGNAIKFSGWGQGEVHVRAELDPASSDVIRFRVADNGIGMAPETIGRVFEPFVQADSSTTRVFGGTGLGLAISKRLAELMGGGIEVESQLHVGSTFTVKLPVLPDQGHQSAPFPDLAGIWCVLVPCRFMVPDDLRAYLESAGARVSVTSSPGDLLAEDKAPDTRVLIFGCDESGHLPFERADLPGVRMLAITYGRRRHARIERASDLVAIDALAMRRRAFLRAVAVAAGRASPEAHWRTTALPDAVAVVDPVVRGDVSILVAEDDLINRKVLTQQLRLLGLEAEFAENGAIALRRWREGRYSLILTDLHMPELDGYALASTIRAEEPKGQRVPILALTANALSDEARRAREAGIDAYLTKPIPLERLREAMREWIPVARANQAPAAAEHSQREFGSNADEALLDTTAIVGIVGDDPKLIHDLLVNYVDSLSRLGDAMLNAAEKNLSAEVARIAHRLKSASRTIGAGRLGDECAAIEAAGEKGRMEEIRRRLANFSALRQRAQSEIDEWLAELAQRSES